MPRDPGGASGFRATSGLGLHPLPSTRRSNGRAGLGAQPNVPSRHPIGLRLRRHRTTIREPVAVPHFQASRGGRRSTANAPRDSTPIRSERVGTVRCRLPMFASPLRPSSGHVRLGSAGPAPSGVRSRHRSLDLWTGKATDSGPQASSFRFKPVDSGCGSDSAF
jgi:hypothetical protein